MPLQLAAVLAALQLDSHSESELVRKLAVSSRNFPVPACSWYRESAQEDIGVIIRTGT